jgi:CubicO group peptidase (beta-lactamase class C family)
MGTKRAGMFSAVVVAAILTTTTAAMAVPSAQQSKPAKQPPAQPAPLITKAGLDATLKKLPGIVKSVMKSSGVPGMAVAVVWHDKVVFEQGFGVRDVNKPDKVDANTVFELASVSKPLASTVVAGAVGEGKLSWNDPIVKYLPSFALSDPYVTDHVTVADMFSHRSGLPGHAGDLLEDLGYDREYVLNALRFEPLAPFRDSYAYTNFGLTAAGVAAANAAGTNWEDLSKQVLYEPLGMTSTSSRFSDYENATDKAVNHALVDGKFEAKYVRDADAQSPAGGASSNLKDMEKWVRLQLGAGKFDGKQVIDEKALQATRTPQAVTKQAAVPAGLAGTYGLGWNVGTDAAGRLTLGHSGAFAQGAATSVNLLPSEDLGVISLTNAAPVGAAETIPLEVFDLATYGHLTVDWEPFLAAVFKSMSETEGDPADYTKPPVSPTPAAADITYVGTYTNPYFGSIAVTSQNGKLTMLAGPKPMDFPLTHFDGNTFTFETTGENMSGLSGAIFDVPGGTSTAATVTIPAWDHNGLGTFTRA